MTVSWSNLWKMEHSKIKFLLRSTYDVLPTLANLLKWGLIEHPNASGAVDQGN